MKLAGILLVIAGLLNVPTPRTTSEEVSVRPRHAGVVLNEVKRDSVLGKAGLKSGDLLHAWKRPANPPSNPEAVLGKIRSPFDWLDLEIEQAPRGPVLLLGSRDGEAITFLVKSGPWGAGVRPILPPTLEDAYSEGETKLKAGNIQSAVRQWESVLADPSLASDRNSKAWVLYKVGKAWAGGSNWQQAIDSYREAVKAADYPSAQFAVWLALGAVHEKRNDFEAAEHAYSSSLEFSKKVNPESLGASTSLTNLGRLAWYRSELDRAQDYFVQGLRIREQLAPESLGVAESLNKLGAVALSRGDLAIAHDYYIQALQLQNLIALDSLDIATTLNNLGIVSRFRGDLEVAQEYGVRALRILANLDTRNLQLAETLGNLGSLARDRGDLDQAYNYLIRSVEILEQTSPEGLPVAIALSNLGTLAWDRGELNRAQNYHLRALEIQQALAPGSLDIATSLNSLGLIAKTQGDIDRALSYQLRALEICETVAPESSYMAFSLSNLGLVFRDKGDLVRAHEYHRRALRIREQIAPESLPVATSLTNLGLVNEDLGNLASAQDYHRRALRIRERLAPRSFAVASSLRNLGNVDRARGELNRARRYYTLALEALELQISNLGGSYNTQASFRALHSDFYSETLSLLLTQRRFSEAFHVLERLRAQTFLTMLAERDTIYKTDLPTSLDRARRQLSIRYDRALGQLSSLDLQDDAEEIAAIRSKLEILSFEANDLEERIRLASPRSAALQYPRPVDATNAQEALDPGTLLLAYHVGEKDTAIFSLSRSEALQVEIVPVGEEAIRTQVERLRSLIGKVSPPSLSRGRGQLFEAESRALSIVLLDPIAERISASERLLILPDGPLHALPFSALMVDGKDSSDGGRFLVEWKPLHFALSATVFAELKQRRRAGSESNSQHPIQLAAFGDPDYTPAHASIAANAPRAVERSSFDWSPLPHTRYEVESIASLFPEEAVRVFLGSESLEERIKDIDRNTRFLHLAAHGYSDKKFPLNSFIALAIPKELGATQDNGLLQVREILEEVRIDADLVVLSACESGLGQEVDNEGLIGLTRAFQYAGARSVTASLWDVADRTTAELMFRFYRHLQSGLPKDEALRSAQLELLRGPIEMTGENGRREQIETLGPYYWAAFQLYGDWQ